MSLLSAGRIGKEMEEHRFPINYKRVRNWVETRISLTPPRKMYKREMIFDYVVIKY